jgi:hypothetical protein
MRRSPGVRSNIITILVVTASAPALGQAVRANFSEEMARGMDEGMVLCEKRFEGSRRY